MELLEHLNIKTLLLLAFFFALNAPLSHSELVVNSTAQQILETPPPVEKGKPKVKKKKKIKKKASRKYRNKKLKSIQENKQDHGIGSLLLWFFLIVALIFMLIGALICGIGVLAIPPTITGLIFLGIGTIGVTLSSLIPFDRLGVSVIALSALFIVGAAFLLAGLLMSLSIFWIVGTILLSIFLLALIGAILLRNNQDDSSF